MATYTAGDSTNTGAYNPLEILMRRPFQRPTVATHLSEFIGYTPLLVLGSTTAGSQLLLKLEQFNPTSTAKIRMARQMVLDAEKQGKLRPGGRIIESTSGNTGLGLAVIAAERGYRFTAVVDHHASENKLRAMKALGAELIYVTKAEDHTLASAVREEVAAKLAAQSDNAVLLSSITILAMQKAIGRSQLN
jgi:cystathionine beta-synthase